MAREGAARAEYFKMFYGDTTMGGGFEGTRCGLEYFGSDRVVFATDAPVGRPITDMFQVIDRLGLEPEPRCATGSASETPGN